MIVDVKITKWERYHINDKKVTLEQVIDTLQVGSPFDLFELTENITIESLDDTESTLTPDENGGHSTIELFADGDTNGVPEFKNGV